MRRLEEVTRGHRVGRVFEPRRCTCVLRELTHIEPIYRATIFSSHSAGSNEHQVLRWQALWHPATSRSGGNDGGAGLTSRTKINEVRRS
jgi:hypothetical protein